MKVIAIARTLNEQDNIIKFFQSYYGFAYKILVADGGSTDNTLNVLESLAEGAEGVLEYRNFPDKAYQTPESTAFMNPQNKHVNFLIDWAQTFDPDWIIFDDVDCWPNFILRERLKSVFDLAESGNHDAIMAYRLYVYKQEGYFKQLNDAGQSLWAWRASEPVRAREGTPFMMHINNIPTENALWLDHPYVLLHQSWQTDETIAAKREFYEKIRGSGGVGTPDPRTVYGPLVMLPDYAYQWREQAIEAKGEISW